ncbi:hypothetical protein KBC80_02335 [Candidatus Woesebacteria bacterium]|jgi:hypothetical protein|nr:hypothetical protein [Candidatus Woesebacteria bacterium]
MVHTHSLLERIRIYFLAHFASFWKHSLGICLILIIPFIEVLSLYIPVAGKIGTVTWILLWIYIAAFTLVQGINLVKTSIHQRSPFALLTIGLFLFLCATNIQSIYSINGENTQEIACALTQLQQSSDWGYRQSCLFGYPTRQFIVPAIPSLLFGNSLAALNIGGAIYFILGLILFCRGIQVYVQDSRKGDALTLLIFGSLLHFHYINHFLFLFEQSIFPLSFALAGCGIWLMYLRTKLHTYLIPLTLLLFVIVFSYTPSLVLLPLSYGAILWQSRRNQTQWFKILGLVIVVLTAIMILSSFMFRSDIKLGHQYPGGIPSALGEIGLAIKHLAMHIYPTPFTTWAMTPIYIILLLAPLLGLFGRVPQLIALWCFGVFCISIYAKGFSYYHIEFRMHRSMVMLPVLLTLWIHLFNKYRSYIPLAFIIFAAFGITISGLQNYKTTQLARPISQQYKFLRWYASQKISQDTTLYLLSAQTPKNNFISMRDISQYFIPHLAINNSYKLPANCSVNDIEGIFLLQETDRCSNTLRQMLTQDETLAFIATYDGVASEPLLVFSRKSEL